MKPIILKIFAYDVMLTSAAGTLDSPHNCASFRTSSITISKAQSKLYELNTTLRRISGTNIIKNPLSCQINLTPPSLHPPTPPPVTVPAIPTPHLPLRTHPAQPSAPPHSKLGSQLLLVPLNILQIVLSRWEEGWEMRGESRM